jgi:hypothetical protein
MKVYVMPSENLIKFTLVIFKIYNSEKCCSIYPIQSHLNTTAAYN